MSTLAAGMAGTLPTALEEDLAACVGVIGQILLLVLLFVVLGVSLSLGLCCAIGQILQVRAGPRRAGLDMATTQPLAPAGPRV